MPNITVYKIRQDAVYDGQVEIFVDDAVMSPIPAIYTKDSPLPIPDGKYAVMRGGWIYVEGEKPPLDNSEQIKMQNKAQAETLLQETDWTEGKSVRDVTRTPHLVNGDAFDDYRVALRAIAVNPPTTPVTDWPVEPDEVWSQ